MGQGVGHSGGLGQAADGLASLESNRADVAGPSTQRRVHLVGAGGTGMKAMAEFLSGAGWAVTGSDVRKDSSVRLADGRTLRFDSGHDASHLSDRLDLLVRSSAIPADNAELAEAERRGVRVATYTELLGELMSERVGVSVAGTHGKSTTTAMVACILDAARLDPGIIIGAEMRGQGWNGRFGDGGLLLAETCEFQRNFLDLCPKHLAILNVEADHFDCFPTVEKSVEAYVELVKKLPEDGNLVIDGDDLHLPVIAESSRAAVVRVSSDPTHEWFFRQVELLEFGQVFEIYFRGQFFSRIRLPVPGPHNVRNAALAAALAYCCGVSRQSIRLGLESFPGIRRRFELVGRYGGMLLIDDYAHHPTAIRATLETARQEFPEKKLVCVFQPHQVLRTRVLMDEFAASLAEADEVLLVPVYGARESDEIATLEASRELARRTIAAGGNARFLETLDRVVATLDHDARHDDVVITMGAGDIDRIQHEFARRVQ